MSIQRTRPALHSIDPAGWVWVGLLLLAFAALFFSTLAVNHSEAEDSIAYILEVGDGHLQCLFHPNHLLFNSFNRVVYNLWLLIGYRGSPELPMQVNNVLAGMLTLLLTFLLAIRLGVQTQYAIACLGAIGVSYGFWWYSVEAETYLLPLPFLILCAHRLLTLATETFRARYFIELGFCVALATLLHQMHALLLLVVLISLIRIWRFRPDIRLPALLRGSTLVATVAVGITAITYLAVAVLVFDCDTVAEVLGWGGGATQSGR